MIRVARVAVSRPMYAFDPATFQTVTRSAMAVWFRRRKGTLNAVMGVYTFFDVTPNQAPPLPDSYEGWVARHCDNRYGGSHIASWDGVALLSTDQAVTPAEAARRVEFLDAMLRDFPQVPAGFDGWWAFPRVTRTP